MEHVFIACVTDFVVLPKYIDLQFFLAIPHVVSGKRELKNERLANPGMQNRLDDYD